jgi:hypothetical protein
MKTPAHARATEGKTAAKPARHAPRQGTQASLFGN